MQLRLRIDNLDGPRVREAHVSGIYEDLNWLGLTWDGEVVLQSQAEADYGEALDTLVKQDRIYGCDCSHRETVDASPSLASDGAAIYSGICRDRNLALAGNVWRASVAGMRVELRDHFLGNLCCDAEAELGDIVVRDRQGGTSYQLASVVTDLQMQSNFIVRGQDLLASSMRQMVLWRWLAPDRPMPEFVHLPLIVGPDGRKLSKRHGDTRLRTLRESGASAGRLRAVLARWSGIEPAGEEMGVDEWACEFDLSRLPSEAAVYDDRRDRRRLFGGG